jgi:hypothetical protein
MKNPFLLGWLKLDENIFLHEVDALRDYISKSENTINSIRVSFEKQWDEEIARDPENKEELHQYYEEEIHKTYKLFPHIAFSSLYISISSLFESSLKKACSTISHPRLTWQDMSGNDFERVRKFLTKVAEIDLTSVSAPWQKVMEHYKLRNLIVHRGSNIEVDDDGNINESTIAGLVTKYSIFMEQRGDFYIQDSKILHDYLNAVQENIQGLYKLLQDRLIKMRSQGKI